MVSQQTSTERRSGSVGASGAWERGSVDRKGWGLGEVSDAVRSGSASWRIDFFLFPRIHRPTLFLNSILIHDRDQDQDQDRDGDHTEPTLRDRLNTRFPDLRTRVL